MSDDERVIRRSYKAREGKNEGGAVVPGVGRKRGRREEEERSRSRPWPWSWVDVREASRHVSRAAGPKIPNPTLGHRGSMAATIASPANGRRREADTLHTR